MVSTQSVNGYLVLNTELQSQHDPDPSTSQLHNRLPPSLQHKSVWKAHISTIAEYNCELWYMKTFTKVWSIIIDVKFCLGYTELRRQFLTKLNYWFNVKFSKNKQCWDLSRWCKLLQGLEASGFSIPSVIETVNGAIAYLKKALESFGPISRNESLMSESKIIYSNSLHFPSDCKIHLWVSLAHEVCVYVCMLHVFCMSKCHVEAKRRSWLFCSITPLLFFWHRVSHWIWSWASKFQCPHHAAHFIHFV